MASRPRSPVGGCGAPAIVDNAAELDARVRASPAASDAISARVNEVSKEVGRIRRDGDVGAAESLQAESRTLGEQERPSRPTHDAVRTAFHELLLRIPNLPHVDTPEVEPTPTIRSSRDRSSPAAFARSPARASLGVTAIGFGILDSERATKIPVRCSRCSAALAPRSAGRCAAALDRNADAFEEIRPPSLVTTATLTATGHLPKFADDAFADRTRRSVVHPNG